MKRYKQFYVWAMNAKLFMGIYFAAITFFSSILLLCFGGKTISLLALLEILGVSMFVAVAQTLLLPDSTDFMRGIFFFRSIVWLILSGAVIGAVAHLGGWFANLPLWCPWVLALAMMIGCVATLVGIRWEQERDTVHLNEALEKYKKE